MTDHSEDDIINRRAFLSASVFSIAGVIMLGFGIPSIIYVVGPALQRRIKEDWIRLGSTSKIEIGVPTLFKVNVTRQTGWITNEEEITVYVITDDGRNYIAISNICTHLGCRVRWIADQIYFFCPCHNGVFDKNGEVVSGPPPRPLEQYDVKIDGETLYIKVG